MQDQAPLLTSAASLSAFHSHPEHAPGFSRVMAGALTAALYVLFALLLWWTLTAPAVPAKPEIVARLLPDTPSKRAETPLPPFIARLIKPRAEKPAAPVFTVAAGAPPQAPVPVPASAAKTSPLQGGTEGNGTMGQAASGKGTGGNGTGLSGCLDPAWVHAVTDRLRQLMYYPGAALANHVTGVVMVHFVVHRDGHLSTLDIGKSSGDWGLDQAALDIFRSAAPLPPIPDHMHLEKVEALQPLDFGVRNFHGDASAMGCAG